MQNVETRTKQTIAEQLGLSLADMRNDANIQIDLGADDLDMVEIVMYIEDEFGIQISDEEWEKVQTIQQAIDLVNKFEL